MKRIMEEEISATASSKPDTEKSRNKTKAEIIIRE